MRVPRRHLIVSPLAVLADAAGPGRWHAARPSRDRDEGVNGGGGAPFGTVQ